MRLNTVVLSEKFLSEVVCYCEMFWVPCAYRDRMIVYCTVLVKTGCKSSIAMVLVTTVWSIVPLPSALPAASTMCSFRRRVWHVVGGGIYFYIFLRSLVVNLGSHYLFSIVAFLFLLDG